MLLSEESSKEEMQNPAMTFPIEKRINVELFIDRTADLESDQRCDQIVAIAGWRGSSIPCAEKVWE